MRTIGLMCEDGATALAVQQALVVVPDITIELFAAPDGHLAAVHLDVLVTDCPPLDHSGRASGLGPADCLLMVSERPQATQDLAHLLSEVVRAAMCPAAEDAPLSERERQVLLCIGEGFTHVQTANRLGISPHTVDTYVKRVRSKLNLGNKAELTRAALQYV